MEEFQKKIKAMETAESDKKEQIKEMDKRLNKAELHTATDKISFGIDFRTRADSIHYKDIRVAPSSLTNMFFGTYPAGFNGAAPVQAQAAMAGMVAGGMVPPVETYDVDNDVIYTNRLRLEMVANMDRYVVF